MPRLDTHKFKALTRLGERSDIGLGKARVLLKHYMLENGLTVTDMAMMTCMNQGALSNLLNGVWTSKGGYIQLHQAFAIEWLTEGLVPAWLWLDDEFNSKRIRDSRMTHIKEFEIRCKRHVLKWNSLKKPDGVLRDRARVLSRLFNVQWSEVKRRAWLDAKEAAKYDKADIKHLLAPEDRGPTQDGIYVSDQGEGQTNEEWFRHTVAQDQ